MSKTLNQRFPRLICEECGRLIPLVALSVLLVAGAAPACAGGTRAFDGGLIRVQAQRPPHGGAQRPPPPPHMRNVEPPPQRRPDARLTEAERRNLHRDLDRANREIYKGP